MTNDRRSRQKAAKQARRQEQAKRQARKETFRRIRIAFGVGAVVAIVLLVSGSLGKEDADLPEAYLDYRDQPTACGAGQPDPETLMSFDAPEPQQVVQGTVAVIATSCGEIRVALDPERAPESASSFVFLARQGFYDGMVFHRIVDGFVAQGGDPEASGFGGPGYTVVDEPPGEDFVYERGVVAMAKGSGRDTTGSQFFVVIGDQARSLPPNYNVIGKLVGGDDALDALAEVPTAARPGSAELSRPLETVYIESITIEG